jgi:hypothetical protein
VTARGITPRWFRKSDKATMGEIRVPFRVTYDGVVNALARIADVRSIHSGTLDRDMTADETMDALRLELRMDGQYALDPSWPSAECVAWAQRHAAKIWNGPKENK